MVLNTCTANSVGQSIACIVNMTNIGGIPMFGITILTLLWLLIFFRNKSTEGTKNSIAATTFFVAIIGILMSILGRLSGVDMFNDVALGILLVITVISMIPLINRNY